MNTKISQWKIGIPTSYKPASLASTEEHVPLLASNDYEESSEDYGPSSETSLYLRSIIKLPNFKFLDFKYHNNNK